MWPNLLESAIRVTPRARLCRFSSVMSGARPANCGASIAPKACIAGSIETVSRRTASRRAHSDAAPGLALALPLRDGDGLGEARQLRLQRAVGVDDEGSAVEHQLVLAADL